MSHVTAMLLPEVAPYGQPNEKPAQRAAQDGQQGDLARMRKGYPHNPDIMA